jgi:lipid II:glycine glycyltransferase (peptidoglycan interpeptide bridge formation enzyme)
MAETTFNIDNYIENLKEQQKKATAKRVEAEAAAKKKKSESNVANRVKAEANMKFQYAETISKSLIDFEGQLMAFGNKIARGDELTPNIEVQ